MQRVSTGSAALDEILGGGFPRNSINIIAGEPGSGKTMLAQQLVFASPPAERPVLYLTTLSEPLAKVVTYLQTTSFADIGRIGTDVQYHSLTDDLMEHPEQLAGRVRELLQEHRPRLVVIDSFKALTDLVPELSAWRTAVFEMAGLLSAYDTTTFLVGEYTPGARPDPVEFAIADGILELRREQLGSRDDRFLRVAKLRGSSFRDGHHSFRISAAGLEVYTRLVTSVQREHQAPRDERLQTGIPQLDKMIASGWLRGTSTLVAGPSGAGKTIIGLHFLKQGVELGEPGLLVSFQENPVQLQRIVSSLGWDAGSLLQRSKIDVLYTSPVELHIDSIIHELFRRIEHQGTKRLVVDALGDLERNARDERRYSDYMYALNQYVARRQVTALLLAESYSLSAGAVPADPVSFMSDNTLLLGMELSPEQELMRTIRIIKARGSAHDGRKHVLRIAAGGVTVE